MSPLDDELRAALHGRAATLTPSPDPLAGIERRASRVRRRRAATAVLGSALAVAAIAFAVPVLTPDPRPTSGPAVGVLQRPANALDWGGAPLGPGVLDSPTVAFWSGSRPGLAATDVDGELLHQARTSDGRRVGVYQLWAEGVAAHLVVSQDGARPLEIGLDTVADGERLVVSDAEPGQSEVVAVAAPGLVSLAYAADGQDFAPVAVQGRAAVVRRTPLPGRPERVKAVFADGTTVEASARGGLGAPVPESPGPTAEPANLLDWPSRGTRREGPPDDQVLLAFARGVTGTVDPEAGTSYRALFSGSTDSGVRFTYGQAWADGQPAYTVGLATGGTQGDQLFLGPVTPTDPPVLAFVLCCEPGSSVETLVVVPAPGTGQVLYDDDATGGLRPVGAGQDYLDGVVLVDRDPRAQSDRLQLLDGDGDLDRPTFEGPVLDLLCARTGCG